MKLCWGSDQYSIVTEFPSPKGGGPIEAMTVGGEWVYITQISIAERRWPH